MNAEALELHVEGGRVCYGWGMCVVGHGYRGLGAGMDEGGGWYNCWSHFGIARAFSVCEVIH